MPTTTATFEVRDDNGRVVREIPNVLSEVRLTACSVSNGSRVMTVDTTEGLYPCMQVCCVEVTEGAYILAIKSSTQIVVSVAATNTASGLTAIFKGQNWIAISKTADRGWWRNLINNGGGNSLSIRTNFGVGLTGQLDNTLADTAISVVPTFSVSGGSGAGVLTALDVVTDDTLQANPSLRTKTEHWSFWTFVSTGGHVSMVPFDPEHSLCLQKLVTA